MAKQIDDAKMKAIVKKVQKAMRLAGNADDDEGQTSLLMAQKLMAKYNLSQSDIDIEGYEEFDRDNKNVVEGDGTEYTRLQWWMKSLASIIADNFKCYTFFRTYNGKSKVVFMGMEQDVAIAKTVYDFAVSSIKFFSDIYIKRNKLGGNRSQTMAIKNDYISGYLNGLKAKFKEQVERENWGLIIIKDALVVQEYEKMDLRSGRSSTATMGGNSQARSDGFKQGKEFSHGTRRIGK